MHRRSRWAGVECSAASLFRVQHGKSFVPRRRILRTGAVLALLMATSTLGGCARVAFYEKGQLSDPIMVMEDDPALVHFYQKIYYSVEGSVGGIGVGAGGGCGCY